MPYPKGRVPAWLLAKKLGACEKAIEWLWPYGRDYERAWVDCIERETKNGSETEWAYWWLTHATNTSFDQADALLPVENRKKWLTNTAGMVFKPSTWTRQIIKELNRKKKSV